MLGERWRITLCGSLTARQGVHVITRFRTQKTGLLLAYLALYRERAHGREELAERFWPDSDRPLHSLRMALASLRQQVEPPGVGQGLVLKATRSHVGLAAGTVRTDVEEFHAAIAAAGKMEEAGQKVQRLREGMEAVSGDLLPGSYMDWVLQERDLLAEQVQRVLRELVELLMAQEEWEQALIYAMRQVHINPLNEEAYVAVMRLLLRLKRPAEVLLAFGRLQTLLWEELGVAPSAEVCALAAEAGSSEAKAAEVIGRRPRTKPWKTVSGAESELSLLHALRGTWLQRGGWVGGKGMAC